MDNVSSDFHNTNGDRRMGNNWNSGMEGLMDLITGFMGNGLSTRKTDTHLTNKKIQSKDRKKIGSWNTGRNENHGVLNTWKWNSSQRNKFWVWNDAKTIARPNRRNSIPKNSGVKLENQNNGFLFGLDTGSLSMNQNRKGGSSWSWSYSWG